MPELLTWPPIFWLARIAVLLALAGVIWVGLLYLIRYVWPKNIRKVATADVQELEALKLLGQELRFRKETDQKQDKQLRALHMRLTEVEEKHQALERLVKALPGAKEAEGG